MLRIAGLFLLGWIVAARAESFVFARLGNEEYRVEVTMPAEAAPVYPVILYTGGGGGAQRGYVVARLPARTRLEVAKSAVRWLRANAQRFSIDDSRVFVWGGALAAALGTTGGVAELEGALGSEAYTSRVRAVVLEPLIADPSSVAPESYASLDDPPFVNIGGADNALAAALLRGGLGVRQAASGADAVVFLDGFAKQARPLPPRPPANPVWADADKTAPAGTEYKTFFSRTVKTDVSYLLYLPPDYSTSGKRYPVIYWLHNFSGTQRSGVPFVALLDGAIRAGQAPAAIVVLVNGVVGSNYVDSADGRRPVESVIVGDLIPHIDATYRTLATRAGRGVEGFSMGGTGAAKLAFKYPDLFGTVAIDAGGLMPEQEFASADPWFRATYGDSLEAFRREDPFTLARQNAANLRRINIRIAAGDADPFYDNNHRLHRALNELGIDHEYVVVPKVSHSIVDLYRVLGVEGALDFYRRAFAPGVRFEASKQPRTWIVNQRHARASDAGTGTPADPFRTISRAAELATAGDTVLVHEGVYREQVTPGRAGEEGKPVTYLAARGERVVVKGSDIWALAWRRFHNHRDVFEATLGRALPAGIRPHAGPHFPRTPWQMFVDGAAFREAETMDDLMNAPRTWMVSPQGDAIYAHFVPSNLPPDLKSFELAVRGYALAPKADGLGHIHVRGFTFEHAGVSTGSGNHWVIENNMIRFAEKAGLEIAGGMHAVRNNLLSENGGCGIAGRAQQGTQIMSNVVERNECGMGFTAFAGGVIEGNLVRDNETYGMRLDSIGTGSRVTRNVIANALEVADAAGLIDNNIINVIRLRGSDAGLTIAHNLVYDDKELRVAGARVANNILGASAPASECSMIGGSRLSRERIIEIEVGAQGAGVRCPRLDGVDVDFYGKQRPVLVAPGPFQALRAGKNLFTLW